MFRNPSAKSILICGLALVPLLLPGCAQANRINVVYGLQSATGGNPEAGLIEDAAGNLYGTTVYWGAYNYGTVFRVSPDGTETLLHSFGNASDGRNPVAALLMDSAGNLYGTTVHGGSSGYGTVFKVAPDGTETVLHSFCSECSDGEYPGAGLVMDNSGNLYGTTGQGGARGQGTVFEIAADGTETVLYSFCQADCSTDGILPGAGLTIDAAGNLYGTTYYGGNISLCGGNGCGTVFELGQDGNEKTLYRFSGSDGWNPSNGLLLDASGNLYGTTQDNVFEITASGNFEVLYTWQHPPAPSGTLIMDRSDNLYGTTSFGGGTGCGGIGCGTVFALAPDGTETVLGSFSRRTGVAPAGGVIAAPDGYLYGTTFMGYGGGCGGKRLPRGCGTVFRIRE